MFDLTSRANANQSSAAKFLFAKLIVPLAAIAAAAFVVQGPGTPQQVAARWLAAVAIAAAPFPFVARLHRARIVRHGLEVAYIGGKRLIPFTDIKSCSAPFGNGSYATVKLRRSRERIFIPLGGNLLSRASTDPFLRQLRSALEGAERQPELAKGGKAGRAPAPLLCLGSFVVGLGFGAVESIVGVSTAHLAAIFHVIWPGWAIVALVIVLAAWSVRLRF